MAKWEAECSAKNGKEVACESAKAVLILGKNHHRCATCGKGKEEREDRVWQRTSNHLPATPLPPVACMQHHATMSIQST